MKSTGFKEFSPKIFDLWANQWMLLTSGDFDTGHYNTMTVAWGSIGQMWNKPFVQVVVRPTRYTYEFMEKYDTFTLCAFPKNYRSALNLLGTKSGKDGDKIAESKLTPVKSTRVASPSFAEAELIIQCRKIYWDDFKPANFLIPDIEPNYKENDYHRVYFGEIIEILEAD
ncbi:flavin reductase [Bacteroidota bacterium]